jgi:hypothetical protein
MNFELIPPLSTPGIGRQYIEALPEPTKELCGDQGILKAVGFSVGYIVYRGTWNSQKNKGEWSFLYSV